LVWVNNPRKPWSHFENKKRPSIAEHDFNFFGSENAATRSAPSDCSGPLNAAANDPTPAAGWLYAL